MKKIPVLMLAVLLAACGGKSDTAASQADAGLPPKPSFKVKFIDSTVTQGLPLGKASEDKTNDGKKRLSYAIEGMDAQNVLEVIGNRPEDLELVSGRCMQTDGQGGKIGWTRDGRCRALFTKLVANVADDADKLTDYLVVHAGLLPYQAGRSGYAAVQNGRYILELDSDGLFFFRRRNI